MVGVLPVVLARFNFGLVPNNKLSGEAEEVVVVVLMGVVDIRLRAGMLLRFCGGFEKSALLEVVPTAAGEEGLINMLGERKTILILVLPPPLMGITESFRLLRRRRDSLLTMVDKFYGHKE